MRALAVDRRTEQELAGRILCHDVRGPDREIVFRKGHVLRADDMPRLRL